MHAVLDIFRMAPWLTLTAILAVAVFFVAPQQLEVAMWKMLLLSGAAYLGYWVDRNVFPYARPHALLDAKREDLAAVAMLRRAIIIAAVVVGAALAV